MISVMDDIVEEDNRGGDGRRVSRDSYSAKKEDYELPEPTVDDSNLTDDYMTEIRKSRLLNSQLNINGALNDKKLNEPLTLISNVKIPNVTRKSRNFTNSNKRLSVLSMYSTKESYRDLNSFVNSKDDKDADDVNKPALRTSIADRLEKAAYEGGKIRKPMEMRSCLLLILMNNWPIEDCLIMMLLITTRELHVLQLLKDSTSVLIPVAQDQNPKFQTCQRMIMMIHLLVTVMKFTSVDSSQWFLMNQVNPMMFLIRSSCQMENPPSHQLMAWQMVLLLTVTDILQIENLNQVKKC